MRQLTALTEEAETSPAGVSTVTVSFWRQLYLSGLTTIQANENNTAAIAETPRTLFIPNHPTSTA